MSQITCYFCNEANDDHLVGCPNRPAPNVPSGEKPGDTSRQAERGCGEPSVFSLFLGKSAQEWKYILTRKVECLRDALSAVYGPGVWEAERAELNDWREAAEKVACEKCGTDERHCGCVVFLRQRLEAAEKVLRAYAKASEDAQRTGALFGLVDADYQYAALEESRENAYCTRHLGEPWPCPKCAALAQESET